MASEHAATLPSVGGRLADRFEILGVLGEGGMGHVFRAYDEQRRREVAVKLITPRYLGRPEREERFFREYELGRRVEGQRHVVQYLGAGRLGRNDWPFLVMELVPGRDIAANLVQGALAPTLATRVAHQVAKAVRALHRAGVVHRDVTTMNVLLSEGEAVLIDLSHAGEVAALRPVAGTRRLTRAHEVPGTHYAMAPEQARSEPARPSMDVYGLGVMLAHMLTGTMPSPYGREDFIVQQREGRVPPMRVDTRVYTKVPPVLAELVADCTAVDPEGRPTVDAVIGRLEYLEVLMPALTAGPEPVVSEPGGPEPAANEPSGPKGVAGDSRGHCGPEPAANEPSGPEVAVAVVACDVEMGPAEPTGRQARSRGAVVLVAIALLAIAGMLGIVLGERRAGLGEGEAVVQRDSSGRSTEVRTPASAVVPAVVRAEVADRAETPTPTESEVVHGARKGSGEGAWAPTGVERGESKKKSGTNSPSKPTTKPVKRHQRARPSRSDPEPAGDDQACAQTVAQATAARKARHWSRLLQLTRLRSCWDDDTARVRLQIKALSALEHYGRCAKLGETSRDPDVQRMATHCALRLGTKSP